MTKQPARKSQVRRCDRCGKEGECDPFPYVKALCTSADTRSYYTGTSQDSRTEWKFDVSEGVPLHICKPCQLELYLTNRKIQPKLLAILLGVCVLVWGIELAMARWYGYRISELLDWKQFAAVFPILTSHGALLICALIFLAGHTFGRIETIDRGAMRIAAERVAKDSPGKKVVVGGETYGPGDILILALAAARRLWGRYSFEKYRLW